MRNDVQRPQEDGGLPKSGRSGGGIATGFRSLSNYMRIVSSGASNVASTVRSAGATIVSSISDRHEDASRDKVLWAGFDKLEYEGDVPRQVLLLGYRSGFQVWDVDRADDVRQLVSRSDGSASFLQMLKQLIASKKQKDKFADVRPLLAVAGDGSATTSEVNYDGFGSLHNGSGRTSQELGSEHYLPTCVQFYSLRIHDFVHILKFRSAVISVRCSPRIVAVSQASQIHCLDAATLETEYTILTSPVVLPFPGSGSIGYGPLAVGTRWLAYSGNQVAISSTTRVSPQDISRATGQLSSTSGSLVAHYAKESSKQLAAGLVKLGGTGYKTFSQYYELLAENNHSTRNRNLSFKTTGAINVEPADIDNAGMVIVRDIVKKSIVVQFRAHTSPISALCFDPSGTLLVTASIHGHNINVFQIIPSLVGTSGGSEAKGVFLHLYRLQRGITNAIIQDISFSDDSRWIMISSSRGTSHLYAINPLGGATEVRSSDGKFSNNTSHTPCSLNFSQECDILSSSPVTLSAVSRIRNGNNGLKGAVSAAAAATGKVSPLPVAVASAFHNCNSSGPSLDTNALRTRYCLLVFSSAGSIIQYMLRQSHEEDTGTDFTGLGTMSQGLQQQSDARLVVEALQKWDVCYKRSRRDRGDNIDIYGDHGNGEGNKLLTKGSKKGTSVYPSDTDKDLKVKHNAEATHNTYIFEAELHTYQTSIPLWAKSKICFQVMMDEGKESGTSSSSEGEIEIERIPVHEIRARSKDLIPLFDNLHLPKVQQARISASPANLKESFARHQSGLSDDGSLSRPSSCGSLDSMSEKGVITEVTKGNNDENSWSPFLHDANKGIVNRCTDDINVKRQLEVVSNSEDLKKKTCPEYVNSTENEKMGTLFVDNDNDVD